MPCLRQRCQAHNFLVRTDKMRLCLAAGAVTRRRGLAGCLEPSAACCSPPSRLSIVTGSSSCPRQVRQKHRLVPTSNALWWTASNSVAGRTSSVSPPTLAAARQLECARRRPAHGRGTGRRSDRGWVLHEKRPYIASAILVPAALGNRSFVFIAGVFPRLPSHP